MEKKVPSLSLICVLLIFASIATTGQVTSPLLRDQNSKAEQPYRLCWDYGFDPAPFRSVATLGNAVFIAEASGHLRAISMRSNQTLWVSELGGSIISIHVDPRFGIFVVNSTSPNGGTSKSILRRLDPESGLANFSIDLADNRGNYVGMSANRLIVSDTGGNISGLDPANGMRIWKSKANGRVVTKPAYGELVVAVATSEKQIEFISSHNGSREASINTKRQITALAFRANQMIISGDDRGNVTNFRDQSGSVWWQFKSGGRIGTISETDEGVLVGSYDNFLYMISKYSGDVTWKRRLDGRIVHQPAVLEKEVVVTSPTESEALVLEGESGKILEQISLGNGSLPVAASFFSNSKLVIPVSTGSVAFSRFGCK